MLIAFLFIIAMTGYNLVTERTLTGTSETTNQITDEYIISAIYNVLTGGFYFRKVHC